MKPKVVVAMSGGVDSSVAACLLCEQGYDVVGLFMRVGVEWGADSSRAAQDSFLPSGRLPRRQGCCSAADAADARRVAGKLGVPFYVLDFKDDFDRIIDYFADEYQRGRTPNPCVICNEKLKFGRLVEYADAIGAAFVATGHHARVERRAGRHVLRRGRDAHKDQSYVLAGIDRLLLARALLPVGWMTKTQVRAYAKRASLNIYDKPDSVEICFVPDCDYARVVRERRPGAFRPGLVCDRHGRTLGEHEGIANFTIGQRRGLGIAAGAPIYVTALNAATNTVVVGDRDELLKRALIADQVNWLVDRPNSPIRAAAKIRYTHAPASATVEPLPGERVCVRFDAPQSAITPGQAVVLYGGDVVLGGGRINEVLSESNSTTNSVRNASPAC